VLLQLLRCHVNVDVCFTANVVFYLYQYLFKGVDTTRYNIIVEIDLVPRREIDDFQMARYVSSCPRARLLGGS
jgi:hypothetical protein